MIENFTEDARQAYVRAQAVAAQLGHNYLGCEHLVVGLAATEGIASRALNDEGVTSESAGAQLERLVGRGKRSDGLDERFQPFTPRLKRAAELAAEASREFAHNYVGPEHILIGILREGDNVGCRLLSDLGANLDKLRFKTLELMGFPQPRNAAANRGQQESDSEFGRVVKLLESMDKRLQTIEDRIN